MLHILHIYLHIYIYKIYQSTLTNARFKERD